MNKLFTLLLSLFAASLPFYGYSLLNLNSFIVFRPDWLFGGLLASAVLPYTLIFKNSIKINLVGKLIILFNCTLFIISVVKILVQDYINLVEASTLWLQLILVSLIYFAITNSNISWNQLKIVLKIWIACAFIVAIYGIYQALARNLDLPLAYINLTNPLMSTSITQAGNHTGNYLRPSSFLAEPAWLGAYLTSPLILTGFSLFYKYDCQLLFANKIINLIIFVALFTCTIICFALSTFITLSILLFLIAWDSYSRKLIMYIVILFILLCPFILLIFNDYNIDLISASNRFQVMFQSFYTGGLESLENSYSRFAGLITGLRVWLNHPFLGVGLNNYQFYDVQSVSEWYIRDASKLIRTWNVWVNILAETGIVGFSTYLSIWLTSLRIIRKRFRQSTGIYKFLFLTWFYILLSDMISSSFNLSIAHPQRWFDLSIASLILYINHKVRCVHR